jgi:hypothetical protein
MARCVGVGISFPDAPGKRIDLPNITTARMMIPVIANGTKNRLGEADLGTSCAGEVSGSGLGWLMLF